MRVRDLIENQKWAGGRGTFRKRLERRLFERSRLEAHSLMDGPGPEKLVKNCRGDVGWLGAARCDGGRQPMAGILGEVQLQDLASGIEQRGLDGVDAEEPHDIGIERVMASRLRSQAPSVAGLAPPLVMHGSVALCCSLLIDSVASDRPLKSRGEGRRRNVKQPVGDPGPKESAAARYMRLHSICSNSGGPVVSASRKCNLRTNQAPARARRLTLRGAAIQISSVEATHMAMASKHALS